MKFADVIIPLPLQDSYTYRIPDEIAETVEVGCRVSVPFGPKKTYVGIVRRLHNDEPQGYEVKPIARLIDSRSIVTEKQLTFWTWIAQYYICPLGDVMNAALPAGIKDDEFRPRTETRVCLAPTVNLSQIEIYINFLKKSKKQQIIFETYLEMAGFGRKEELLPVSKAELLRICSGTQAAFKSLVEKNLLTTYEHEIGRLNTDIQPIGRLNPLSAAQSKSLDEIGKNFNSHAVTLLHGVTSSGKTEIYIHLISRALSEGKQVLYLLPEIALTTQITDRLQRVFGGRMGVYHSKFSDAERVEVYKKQLSDSPFQLILGVRSSIFLPFSNLGLVIVDEEHETSYKQQEPAPRYHARNGAIMLASFFGAKTLLGTATPSVEVYNLALAGRYGYVRLSERFRNIELPDIEVVDVKRLKFQRRMKGVFSPQMLDSIGDSLSRGEQVILFQNRRGYSNLLRCRTCGWVPQCEHCDVSLTYHKRYNQLVCHYCGATYPLPEKCPQCGDTHFSDIGAGTEKVESEIQARFPEARTIRMDIDTAHTRTAYEQIIGDFAAHRYDILIGTQMVSKGLDFDNVSVVGILDADTMLNQPDFRSHERTFHMLAQVAGRAGRKNHKGHVILQTHTADSEVIDCVVQNDYERMFNMQMEERQLFRYPPFYRLINVFVRHRDSSRADLLANDLCRMLRNVFGNRVLGPDRPPVSRVHSMYIRKLILKIEKDASPAQVRTSLMAIQQQLMMQPSANGAQVYYDVDPM